MLSVETTEQTIRQDAESPCRGCNFPPAPLSVGPPLSFQDQIISPLSFFCLLYNKDDHVLAGRNTAHRKTGSCYITEAGLKLVILLS